MRSLTLPLFALLAACSTQTPNDPEETGASGSFPAEVETGADGAWEFAVPDGPTPEDAGPWMPLDPPEFGSSCYFDWQSPSVWVKVGGSYVGYVVVQYSSSCGKVRAVTVANGATHKLGAMLYSDWGSTCNPSSCGVSWYKTWSMTTSEVLCPSDLCTAYAKGCFDSTSYCGTTSRHY